MELVSNVIYLERLEKNRENRSQNPNLAPLKLKLRALPLKKRD
jgi:hypothetical protein